MKIISIGSNCQVKYHIDKMIGTQETQFFDWLITDFKSVLYLLENINDQEVISNKKFTNSHVFLNRDCWIDEHHKVEHKDFKMVSLHDFPSNIPYTDYMDEFTSKYKRRLDRLKNIIHLNENIHMIHSLDYHNQFTEDFVLLTEDVNKFFELLNKINPYNRCYLHIAIPPKFHYVDVNNVKKNDRTFIYKLNEKYFEGTKDWTDSQFNWEVIFCNIIKIR